MIIEFLAPEAANLFGELGDMGFLRKTFPRGEFIETALNDKPAFLERKVDLVFLGPMPEQTQLLLISRLRPYADEIKAKIEAGGHFLFVGNAMEIFGEYIEDDFGHRTEALGIFPFYTKQQMFKRRNSLFLGDKNGMPILGSKSSFTQIYESEKLPAFCTAERGPGRHEGSAEEGIHYKNFIGTSILGPFLIINIPFTERWLKELSGIDYLRMPFAAYAFKAYHNRLEELRDPKTTI